MSRHSCTLTRVRVARSCMQQSGQTSTLAVLLDDDASLTVSVLPHIGSLSG
jgi:hypothetical protein